MGQTLESGLSHVGRSVGFSPLECSLEGGGWVQATKWVHSQCPQNSPNPFSPPTMGWSRTLKARARLRVVGLLEHVPPLYKCFLIILLYLFFLKLLLYFFPCLLSVFPTKTDAAERQGSHFSYSLLYPLA